MSSADTVALRLAKDSIATVVCTLFDNNCLVLDGLRILCINTAAFDQVCKSAGWDTHEVYTQIELADRSTSSGQLHLHFKK